MQNDKKINQAISFLRNNIDEIYTVSEWAYAWGYTRGYFAALIKEEFGETPYTIIRREKHKKIKQLVRKNPERKGRAIADDAGFSNVKSLGQFLNYHFDLTLSDLREAAK